MLRVDLILRRFVSGPLHHPRHEIRGRDAVGQDVVHLADHCDPIAGQSFGVVELPQRAAAVEGRGRDRADHRVEFPPTAGRGHLHPLKVIVQIEVGLLAPNRAMQTPRCGHELIAQRLENREPGAEHLTERLECRCALESGRVDDRHLQGVLVDIRRLAGKQQHVPTAESFHRRLSLESVAC